jgi:hypothetical protein
MVKSRARPPHVRGRSPGARPREPPGMLDAYEEDESEWEPKCYDQQYRKAATGFYNDSAIVETVFRKPKEFADLHQYDDIPLIDRVPTAVGFHSLDSAESLNEEKSRISRYEFDVDEAEDDEDDEYDVDRQDVEESRQPLAPRQDDDDDDIDDNKYSNRSPADNQSVWSDSSDSCPPVWRSFSDEGSKGKDWATNEAQRRRDMSEAVNEESDKKDWAKAEHQRDLSEALIPMRKSNQGGIQQISPTERESDRKRQQAMQERYDRDPPAQGREFSLLVKTERVFTRDEIEREHPTTPGTSRSGQVPVRKIERVISRTKSMDERKELQQQQDEEQAESGHTESVESGHSESIKSGSNKSGSIRKEAEKTDSIKSGSTRNGSAKSESIRSRSVKSGSIRKEAAKTDSIESGSAKNGSVKTASIRSSSVKSRPITKEASNTDSVKSGSAKNISVKTASIRSNSVKSRSNSVKNRSITKEAAKTASVKSGSAKNISAQTASIRSNSVKSRSITKEVAKTDSVKSGSAKNVSAKTASIRSSSVKSRSNMQESAKPDSVKGGSAKNVSVKSASSRKGSVKSGFIRKESAKPNSVKSGSAKNVSVKSASIRKGSVKSGFIREESAKPHSVKGGSAKNALVDESTPISSAWSGSIRAESKRSEIHSEIEMKKKHSKKRLPIKPVTGGIAASAESSRSFRSWFSGSKVTKKIEKKSSPVKPPKAEVSKRKTNPPSAKKEERSVRPRTTVDAPPTAKAVKNAPGEKGPTKKSKQTKSPKSDKKSVLDYAPVSNNTKSTGVTSKRPDPIESVSSADEETETEDENEPDWSEEDNGEASQRNGMDAIEASRNPAVDETKPTTTTTSKEPEFVSALRSYHCETLASTVMTGLSGLAHLGLIHLDEEDASRVENPDAKRSPAENEHGGEEPMKSMVVVDGWEDEEEEDQRPEERIAPEGRESRGKSGGRKEEDDEESASKKHGDDQSLEADSNKRDTTVTLMIRKREGDMRETDVPQRINYFEGNREAGRPESRGSRSRSASRPRSVQLEERSLQLDGEEEEDKFDEEEEIGERVAENRRRALDKQVAQVFVPDSPRGIDGMSISTIEIPTPMVITAYQQEDDGSVSILGLMKKPRNSRRQERVDEDPIEEGEEIVGVEAVALTPSDPVAELKKGKPSFIGKFLRSRKSRSTQS